MNVLYLIQRFLPSIGGAETHLFYLAKHISSKNRILVMTFGRKTSYYIFNGIPVKSYTGLEIMWRSGFNVLSVGMIKDLLRTKPDIIHTHTYGFFQTDLAALIGHIRSIPVIITTHYDRSKSATIVKRILRFLYDNFIGRLTLHLATHIIATTQYEKEFFTSMFSIKDEKVSVIPNAIEIKKYIDLPDPDPLIKKYQLHGSRIALFVGRIESKKGIQFLLKSAPEIIKKVPNVKFLIVGPDWGYQTSLELLSKQLNISSRVIFSGRLSEQDLLRAYNLCEVVILPSLGEATGLTILEAMASRKPVIASRLPTIEEFLIDGKNGLLFYPGNIEMLQDTIVRVINDQDLRNRLVEEGFRTAYDRDLSKMGISVQNIYDSVIS